MFICDKGLQSARVLLILMEPLWLWKPSFRIRHILLSLNLRKRYRAVNAIDTLPPYL
jgi:hypothetical protein